MVERLNTSIRVSTEESGAERTKLPWADVRKSAIIGTVLFLTASSAAQRGVGEEYTCGQLESSAGLFGDAVFVEESLTYCPNAHVSSASDSLSRFAQKRSAIRTWRNRFEQQYDSA
jgi:hypothetical protein